MLRNVLPSWATCVAPGHIVIDATGMYEEWLPLVGCLQEKDITQYHLECAFQCGKLDVIQSVSGNPKYQASPGSSLEIVIRDAEKDAKRWIISEYPEGLGVEKASREGEARKHFKRVRGIGF